MINGRRSLGQSPSSFFWSPLPTATILAAWISTLDTPFVLGGYKLDRAQLLCHANLAHHRHVLSLLALINVSFADASFRVSV